MREVTINGYNVSTYQLGVVGEHNATKLIVTPPSELINDRVSYYRCMFKLRNKAGPLVTPKYTSYPMEVMLVQALTLNSSFAMCIIAYDENGKYLAISKKIEGFYFNPSDYNALTDHIKEYLDDPLIDLQKILDGKADVTYVDTKCEELEEQLDNKADKDYIDGKLDSKVDKEEGKGLSSNDFTDELKAELETAYRDRHIHNNLMVLDDLSDSGNNTLYYNGEVVGLEPLTNQEMVSIIEILAE